MKENVTIHAVMDDGVPMMFKTLIDTGVDVSKCFICEDPIVRTERPPRCLKERWDAWRHKKKFYEWNIGAFYRLGVVCDETQCFVKLLDINQVDDLLKTLMDTHGKTESEAIEWMKELGYDTSRLEEE